MYLKKEKKKKEKKEKKKRRRLNVFTMREEKDFDGCGRQ
jgi:hypothetical protein